MRWTQTLRSHRRRAFGSTRQRVAAVLGLFALGFLLGHVHPAHEGELDRLDAQTVSSDDNHHEHSPHIVLDATPCVGCRSFDENEIASNQSADFGPIDAFSRAYISRVDRTTLAPFVGLPATRAPPIV